MLPACSLPAPAPGSQWRIGIDATALYGAYGGVEYALWNLLQALARARTEEEYVVFIPRDGPGAAELLKLGGGWHFRRLPFRGGDRWRRILWQQLQLPGQLLREGCSLLHAPTYVAPLHLQVPLVLTVYDLIALQPGGYARRANRLHYGLVTPRVLPRATRIIVPSAAVKRDLAALTSRPEGICVIPLGVEAIFHPATADCAGQDRRILDRYNLPPDFLLYTGNFEPKKNLPVLLEAWRSLADRPPLVLVGGARPWGRGVGLAGAAGLHLPGYLPRHHLPALFRRAAAFVFPTLAEGFGLPVLEALACGTPVITTAAVPLPGLEHAAKIVEPSTAALAAAISSLLHSSSEQEALRHAGPTLAQPYTWEAAATATRQIYRQVYREAGEAPCAA